MKNSLLARGQLGVVLHERGEKQAGKISFQFGGRVDASGEMVDSFSVVLDRTSQNSLRRTLERARKVRQGLMSPK